MPSRHYIYAMSGTDASSNSLTLRREHTSFSVNMSYRGNLASTRPPFEYITAEFPYDSDPEVVSTFNEGNVTGVFPYLGTTNLTQSYLIVAIADSIYAGLVTGDIIRWRRIYKGIDPKWQMSFFCQHDQFLIWQNGKDLPLFWDGIATSMIYCKDAPGVESPMPIGNIMVAAHGRIFVATEENLVFASNHAYSNNLKGYGIFNWTETTYFTDGDGFGAPAPFGRITGGTVIKKVPDANSQGPVLFLLEKGAFVIDAAEDRVKWLANPNIQQIILTGRGCSSPFSVVSANSDIWYRCNDNTVSSFKVELSSEEKWKNRSLSREVRNFTDFDSETTLTFSPGLFVDNRLLMGVGSRNALPVKEEFGLHRYCTGMVVLDLDAGSTIDDKEPYTWQGLWTGPRVTGAAEVIVAGEKSGLVFSFDEDGTNRVYRIGKGVKNDITPEGTKKIRSAFINEGIFYEPGKVFTFNSTKIKYLNADKDVRIKQSYKTEDYQLYQELGDKDVPGRLCPIPVEEGTCHSDSTSALMSGVVTFRSGCTQPRIGSTSSDNKGEWFALLTEIEGALSIRYIKVFGDGSDEDIFEAEARCITEPIDVCGPAESALTYSFP